MYESSPKHGSIDRGNISRRPINGQAALDHSIQIKETSTRRIGIDRVNREIVVFDETLPGIFHGHVRSWEQLTTEMQNVLVSTGLIDRKGRIQSRRLNNESQSDL